MLKTVSSITNALGALNYKGTWDANANSPALTSSVGTKGDYYVVGTAGSTNLNGISNWGIGDWAAFNGSAWQRVEGGANLNGVDLSVSGTSTLSGLTASTALALNASKEIVSVTNTGTGNNVLATAPTLVGDVSLSTGNLVVGTSTKGVTTSGANALRFGTNGSTSQASLTSNSNITLGSTDLPYLYVDTSNAKGVANLNAGLGKCLAGGVSPVSASGGTADFNVGFFAMGFLLVNNEVLADGAQYTSKTYSVFTRGGGAFTATEIATANGTSGGATFTVTWVGDSTIRVTNTQGNTTSVRFAYFGL